MSLSTIKNNHKVGKEFRLKLKELDNITSEDVYDTELTIIEFDISKNAMGEYCAVMFKEIPNSFYFGKSVLTDLCKEIEADNEALEELHRDGLKVKICEATSKGGRKYENVIIL